MTFSALDVIHLISPHPLLLIAGGRADSREQNELAYKAASEPKELFIVDDATHLDLYDVDRFVTPVADKLADYYARNL